VITPEVARSLSELSLETKRQIGLLINRNGNIEQIIAGDSQKVTIPPIHEARVGMGRLLGLRLVHTHLKGEFLSRDDLTDLALLRLDLISAIEVLPSGLPGHVYSAYLLPDNDRKESWEIFESPDPHGIDLNFLSHIHALEDEFARTIASKSVNGGAENTVLAGVFPSTVRRWQAVEWMEELRELALSSGLNIMEEIIQFRPSIDPKYVIGKGKLQDLAIRSMQVGADVIIFGEELSPRQLKSISEVIDLKVIDRTQLILDIFAQHAHTRDGKIQVELAQLKYLLPRLVGRYPSLSRLRGGIGLRGPGETKLEIDRRRVRDRISRLERQVEDLGKARGQRRLQRYKKGLPIISIVGYTNAGKSTLLNSLTRSHVKVENKLFATLDPSSRRLRFPRERDVIITDTVGFIRDLPPELVKAFRSTLEELDEADLLLNVVDLSNPNYLSQMDYVEKFLYEINLEKIPQILVFNKIDRVTRCESEKVDEKLGSVAISAKKGLGLDKLINEIAKKVFSTTY
jgi:GTP-binding protein HflX